MNNIEVRAFLGGVAATVKWVTAACTLLFVGWVQAIPFDHVYVFGDSLSDSGNVFALSGGAAPVSPPYAGQFSNGDVWVPQFAERAGLAVNNFYAAGGLGGVGTVENFALGGASAGSGNAVDPRLFGLAEQVATASALGIDDEALVVVWAGANDIIYGTLSATDSAAAVLASIDALAGFGGSHFLVINIPNIGLTPLAIGAGTAVQMTEKSQLFNDTLAAGLSARASLDIETYDAEAALSRLVADVGSGSFTAYGPCLPAPTAPECLSPDTQGAVIFWDAIHPTTAVHGIVADDLAAMLPLPGSLALFLSGLVLVRSAGYRALRRGWGRRLAGQRIRA